MTKQKFVEEIITFISFVVDFDLHLGAAHPKRWSKSSFTAFLVLKS